VDKVVGLKRENQSFRKLAHVVETQNVLMFISSCFKDTQAWQHGMKCTLKNEIILGENVVDSN